MLEVAPVSVLLPLIYLVRGPSPSALLMVLLCLHGVILMVGGKYTYARVPIGFTVADRLGWQRNPYDRLGHLAQGFVPALIAREVLLRTSPLVRGKWLAFLCVSIALAFSALYELIEWQAAVWTGEAAESFLGTQGGRSGTAVGHGPGADGSHRVLVAAAQGARPVAGTRGLSPGPRRYLAKERITATRSSNSWSVN
ncbi:MAG: DUF2238 domain-containing protein [Planctomycetota bacterium]